MVPKVSNQMLLDTFASLIEVFRCLALPQNKFLEGEPRSRRQREAADAAFTADDLWDVFGINPDVTVS